MAEMSWRFKCSEWIIVLTLCISVTDFWGGGFTCFTESACLIFKSGRLMFPADGGRPDLYGDFSQFDEWLLD